MSDFPTVITPDVSTGHDTAHGLLATLFNLQFTQGTLSQRPTAGHARRTFYATDTEQWFRDDGTTWHEILMGEHAAVNDTAVWVDVRSRGIAPASGDVGTAVNVLMASLLTTTTTAQGQPTIYFGAGNWQLATTIAPPAEAGEYTVRGAGRHQSYFTWTGGNAEMFKLVNARGVLLERFGLYGNATGANTPTYGVRFHRASPADVGGAPTFCHMRDVFIGGYGTEPNPTFTTAVGYTADAGYDLNNDLGNFENVDIYMVGTGYRFGTLNTLWHNLIGGTVAYCTVACIDNTPVSPSTWGGTYHVYGTRFGTSPSSGTVFRLGPNTGNNSIDVFGMYTEAAFQLIDTPATIGAGSVAQRMRFFGGHADCLDPGTGDTVKWDASYTYSALEFHGFTISSPNGVRFHFPSAGPTVRFIGGTTVTSEWKYNCRVEYAATEAAGAPTFTNLGSGDFQHLRGEAWREIGAGGNPAFQNGWTNFGGGFNTAAFYKIGDRVYLKGMIAPGVTDTTAFTLPVGYRPAATTRISTTSNGSVASWFDISSSGAVGPHGPGTSTWTSIEGSFRAVPA